MHASKWESLGFIPTGRNNRISEWIRNISQNTELSYEAFCVFDICIDFPIDKGIYTYAYHNAPSVIIIEIPDID